jgi:type IV pilus assembly protein PilE
MDGTHADALAQENGRMRSTVTAFNRRRSVDRLPRGFTLIEVMIVVVIIALLATVALPAYLDQVRKSRRADAIARISQFQQAQERWRSNNATYGTLANLGIGATTADGHYSLSMTASPTATTYQLLATATGAQASDTNCKFLALSMSGGNTTLLSGPNSSVGNTGSANSRCWNR